MKDKEKKISKGEKRNVVLTDTCYVIMQSEESQSQKTVYHKVLFICKSRTGKTYRARK